MFCEIFKAMRIAQSVWTFCVFAMQRAGCVKEWSWLLMFLGQKVDCTGATVYVLLPASVSNAPFFFFGLFISVKRRPVPEEPCMFIALYNCVPI